MLGKENKGHHQRQVFSVPGCGDVTIELLQAPQRYCKRSGYNVYRKDRKTTVRALV